MPIPSADLIRRECLEICALAQTRYLSAENFHVLPYLMEIIEGELETVLIEKALAVAVKARFLDDRSGLLAGKDRKNLSIGKYFENEVARDELVSIRHALNKLVHHNRINIRTDAINLHVFNASGNQEQERFLIGPGSYHHQCVTVVVEGDWAGKSWRFEIDLFTLLNELLRVLD